MSRSLYAGRQKLSLGDRIGQGGEGVVYALDDSSGRAVKVYSKADTHRHAKIQSMVRSGLAAKSEFVAFPLDMVVDGNGQFVGFLMKRVEGHRPIFELYAPGARKDYFPKANYPFLVRAAANIARSVASVHRAGCVIGDINHSGILVSQKATAILIDADSFQIIDGANRFLCRVGVPEYTAPELQGVSLSAVTRTVDHDAFGLAVVIFHLLCMGRHPYAGRTKRGEQPTLPEAIRTGRFAYTLSRDVGMEPPPGAATLLDFPADIRDLFERAFALKQKSARPAAEQWVRALAEFEECLVTCAVNKLHHHPKGATACPWCRMERVLSNFLFIHPGLLDDSGGVVPDPGESGFDLTAIAKNIGELQLPTTIKLESFLATKLPKPSAGVKGKKRKSGAQSALGALILITAAGLFFAYPGGWVLWLILAGVGFSRFDDDKQNAAGKDAIAAYQSVAKQWYETEMSWRERTGIVAFEKQKELLVESEKSYRELKANAARETANYKKNRKARQLHAHLEHFLIRRVKIRGIGDAKTATLASFGIETAADVERSKVLSVPGFGPTNSKPLLDWRSGLEKRFVYDENPNNIDKRELNRIRNQAIADAARLRSELISGPAKLTRILETLRRTAGENAQAAVEAFAKYQQARVDLEYLGIPVPQISRPSPKPPKRTGSSGVSGGSRTDCPQCGSSMVLRTARRGRNRGSQFWGCSHYPRCKGTRSV